MVGMLGLRGLLGGSLRELPKAAAAQRAAAIRPVAAPQLSTYAGGPWVDATCLRSPRAASSGLLGFRVRSYGGSHRRGIHATRRVEAKRDYYEVLGLSRGADEKEVKKAYRKLGKAALPCEHSRSFGMPCGHHRSEHSSRTHCRSHEVPPGQKRGR